MEIKILLSHSIEEVVPYPVRFNNSPIERVADIVRRCDVHQIRIHRLELREELRQSAVRCLVVDVIFDLTRLVRSAIVKPVRPERIARTAQNPPERSRANLAFAEGGRHGVW